MAKSYLIMQKVNIALEMVTTDLLANGDFGLKKGNFWRLTTDISKRIVEALYVHMRSRGFDPSTLPVLRRTVVPAGTRCLVTTETGRDLRDAILLKDVVQISHFIRKLLHFYTRKRVQSGFSSGAN